MKLMNTLARTPAIAASITPALHIEHLSKVFNEMTALSSIDFSLKKGDILALLGPSGCGKTTLLRCIAGLLEPSAGRILIDGDVVVDERSSAVPEKRRLGMVFQDYALWPHMTVAENIAFPLSMQGIAKSERREKVFWALQVVGLEHLADRSPDTLSGGQQQRIALARAIVAKPRLLLMDEPLSNLDKGLRDSLAIEIRALIKQLNLTAVFVTHDQQEAFAMADQVAILQQGRLQQFDSAEVLYRTPATPAVAEFLDSGVLLKCRLTEQGLDVEKGLFSHLPFHAESGYQGEVTVLMHRASLSVNSHSGVELQQAFVIFTGEHYQLSGLMGGTIPIRLQSSQRPDVGQSIYLSYEGDWLHAWDADDRPLTLKRYLEKNNNFVQP